MIPFKSALKWLLRSALWSTLTIALCSFFLACLYFALFIQENTKSTVNNIEGDRFSSREDWFQSILSTDHLYEHERSDMYQQFLYLEHHCLHTRAEVTPKFTKFVLMIIDALRADFLPTIHDESAQPKMPYLEALFKTNGIALQSIAAMPTVTVPSTKAILSGTLPTFVEYLEHLNAYTIERDNIVTQFKKQNARIHFYGDHVWGKLFEGQNVFTRYNETFTVPDYVSADLNVSYNMRRSLRHVDDWDVMMLHYSGVDQIGHMYQYGSKLFGGKLLEMDNELRAIFDTLKKEHDSTLIMVTGDHGMNAEGNHGGNSRDETHTVMIFLTPDDSFHNKPVINLPLDRRTFLQVDFVPTIASLFHFPIPVKSQGRVMSPVLNRFNVNSSQHLCALFENVFQLSNVTTHLRSHLSSYIHLNSYLLEAMKYHALFVKNGKVSHFALKAQTYYQKFLHQVQEFYGENQSNYLRLTLDFTIVLASYSFAAILFLLEYHNPASILFWDKHLFQKLTLTAIKRQLIETLKTFDMAHIILVIFVTNFFFLISTDFMQLESFFWHAIAVVVLVLQFIFMLRQNIRTIFNFQNLKLTLQLAISLFLLSIFMINWRQVNTIEDAWGADTNLNDIYSELHKSTVFSSFLFALSIVVISYLSVKAVPISTSFIVSSSYLTIYIFKTQNNSLISAIPFSHCANLCTQVILSNTILALLYFIYFTFRKPIYSTLVSKESKNNFEILRQCWTVLVCTQLDPFMLPLFLLHILLEKLINSVTANVKASKLHSLGMYIIFANSAFYQVGNSNGLSTLNVNSCFHGFNGSQSLSCTSFMFITVFSTYIYWILSFFVAFYIYEKTEKHSESSQKIKPTTNNQTMSSIIATIQIWRLSLLTMMLTLALIMRNHPFIWPVVAPKLLYELLYTFVNLAIAGIVVALFKLEENVVYSKNEVL